MSVTHRPQEGASSDQPLRLCEIDPSADARWDTYVSTHAEGLVYHTSAWLRVLQREYGQTALGLAVEDAEGTVHGVLPLMATKGLPLGLGGSLVGRRLSSLPRTPVAGPLAGRRDGLALLVRGAVQRIPQGAQLQLKPAEAHLDGLADRVVAHPWRVTYVLELPDRPEQIRFGNSRNNARVRATINSARRQGVTVRRADSIAGVRNWYQLYLQAMRHHAVPARPLRFFEAMWDELRPRGMMRLLLAERDHELLAGSVLLMFGRTVFYAFNGASRSEFSLRPNDLLQWQAIRDACADGFQHYDLGEVADGEEGLAHFKRKWGAQERRLQRYSSPPPRWTHNDGERKYEFMAGLLKRGWSSVPLQATAVAGRLIYRYL